MMLWLLFVAMSLATIAFAIRPLLKDLPRQTLLVGTSIVLITAIVAGLYYKLGSPDIPSGASQAQNIEQMVASLAERLQREPADIDGWIMLGRSYMTLGNYQGAATAYESALALDPGNPEALFWGGISASNSGNARLAIERWERLLETDPPGNVRRVLLERIAEWRSEPLPPTAVPAQASASVVAASISLSVDAQAVLAADASVFIIARDPARPSPPIAVRRRLVADLPLVVELGDQESMIPGRNLSAFSEFEMLARVSLSGNPIAQPGDWFASVIVRPADSKQVELVIADQVQ
ncbi:MAG: tetratricopeptide repeat protein [Proteobacteria bacterium]|nr:tetratricopeptide repeat protein [Pseudomonadota bacterium]